MITLVTELSRAPEVSVAELHAHLRGEFRDRVAALAGGVGLEQFILSARIPDPDIDGFSEARGWAVAPDALLQLSFATAQDAMSALAAASGHHLLSTPELAALVDGTRTSTFAATETIVFDSISVAERWGRPGQSDGPVKMIVQAWKRPDLTFEEFTGHWRDAHAPLVREHGPAMGFRRYVQSHRVQDPGLVSAAASASQRMSPDGMAEVWWTDRTAMHQGLASTAGLAASALMEKDEKEFLNPPAMWAFVARESLEIDHD